MASPPERAKSDTQREDRLASVRARARAAFQHPGDRADLAELVYDSLAARRTSSDRFWLVFQHHNVQLQLSVTGAGSGWDLTFRLDPPSEFRADLELDGEEVALVEISTRGTVSFQAIPRGVMRLVLHQHGAPRPVHTDWFLLGARPAR